MEQIGILCSELISQFNSNIKKSVTETGLSINQAKVLMLASIFNDSKMSQKDMAKICRTDTPAMSRTIDKLEEAGYIIRGKNDEDSRCVCIELSETGKEKSEAVKNKHNEVYNSMLSKLTEDERQQLLSLLEKMAESSEILEKINETIETTQP